MLLSLRRNYPATGGPPRARYIGTEEKMDAAEVARIGFRAMMDGGFGHAVGGTSRTTPQEGAARNGQAGRSTVMIGGESHANHRNNDPNRTYRRTG
jgi:hypothetical protein